VATHSRPDPSKAKSAAVASPVAYTVGFRPDGPCSPLPIATSPRAVPEVAQPADTMRVAASRTPRRDGRITISPARGSLSSPWVGGATGAWTNTGGP